MGDKMTKWEDITPQVEGDIVEFYLDSWDVNVMYITTTKYCYIATNLNADKPVVQRHTSEIVLPDGNQP